MLQNISHFGNTGDYLPIITAALIVDMVIIFSMDLGYTRVASLTAWYESFGGLAVLADVLSITIGVILARFVYTLGYLKWDALMRPTRSSRATLPINQSAYTTVFSKYSLSAFLAVTCAVQVTHDLLFTGVIYGIPRGNSRMLDVFKDYGDEVGVTILLIDAAMMISTVLLASWFAGFSQNFQVILLIVALYILPYLLYSIPVGKK